MRQIILAATALLALASHADAAARIPAPATTAIQLTGAIQLIGGIGHGARPNLPRDMSVAQIAPATAAVAD